MLTAGYISNSLWTIFSFIISLCLSAVYILLSVIDLVLPLHELLTQFSKSAVILDDSRSMSSNRTVVDSWSNVISSWADNIHIIELITGKVSM